MRVNGGLVEEGTDHDRHPPVSGSQEVGDAAS